MRVSYSILIFALLVPAVLLSQSTEKTRPRSTGNTSVVPGSEQSPPEAIVILREELFNGLLDAVFSQLKAPSYPLSLAGDKQKEPRTVDASFDRNTPVATDQCSNVIQLEREENGVKTAVHFKDGKITAPLAFSGTYNVVFVGCVKFQGWASTNLKLYFDQAHQSLNARVDVDEIHLSGAPALARGTLIAMVQSSLDRKINPLVILQVNQLSAKLPIPSAGGAISVRAKDVKPEVGDGELRLHISYEFPKQ